MAVIGGELVGCETAELLAENGCQVVVFEALLKDGIDIGPPCGLYCLAPHEQSENQNHHQLRSRNGENSVVVVRERGRQAIQGIDTVVLAAGATPRNEIVEDIKATGVAVHVIGDALEPRKAIDAIHQAFETAYAL